MKVERTVRRLTVQPTKFHCTKDGKVKKMTFVRGYPRAKVSVHIDPVVAKGPWNDFYVPTLLEGITYLLSEEAKDGCRMRITEFEEGEKCSSGIEIWRKGEQVEVAFHGPNLALYQPLMGWITREGLDGEYPSMKSLRPLSKRFPVKLERVRAGWDWRHGVPRKPVRLSDKPARKQVRKSR